jgi:hypothetical protein
VKLGVFWHSGNLVFFGIPATLPSRVPRRSRDYAMMLLLQCADITGGFLTAWAKKISTLSF